MEIKDRLFCISLHLKDRLDKEFIAYYGELIPEEALTSFTVSNTYC